MFDDSSPQNRKRFFYKKIFHGLLQKREIGLRFEDSPDFQLICPFVGLGAGAVHGGPFAAV